MKKKFPAKTTARKEGVQRISISLPAALARQLDALVQQRGFRNRSQAVSEMIHQEIDRRHLRDENVIMAGTITLFYQEGKASLTHRLAAIQRSHIDEVISSQHVLLENNHTMEVLLVQGPAKKLNAIADELVSCKGVTTGGLNLSTAVLPPIYKKET